jgi:hypothetical protein
MKNRVSVHAFLTSVLYRGELTEVQSLLYLENVPITSPYRRIIRRDNQDMIKWEVSSHSGNYSSPSSLHWLSYHFKREKRYVRPITVHEGLEREKKYSPTLSLTSALDGDGRLRSRPGRSTPGKMEPVLILQDLGEPQGRCERVRKMLHPPEFDPRTIQPVASRYTDPRAVMEETWSLR